MNLEAGDKLAKAMRQEMDIIPGSNILTAPAVREEGDASECAEFLERREASRYRGVAARDNYMGLERPDAQHGIKEVCRGMARPNVKDLAKVKRLARCLQAEPRLPLQSGGEQRQGMKSMHTSMRIGRDARRADGAY